VVADIAQRVGLANSTDQLRRVTAACERRLTMSDELSAQKKR